MFGHYMKNNGLTIYKERRVEGKIFSTLCFYTTKKKSLLRINF